MRNPHQLELPTPVHLRWRTEAVRDAVADLAELAGVRLGLNERQSSHAVLILEETAENPPRLRAHFHPLHAPYFGEGEAILALEEEAELVELMIGADTTLRGIVVGVIGATGGAGATTIASVLAHRAARSCDVALVDADPLSAGYTHWLGVASSGLAWPDLAGAPVPFVPARLAQALPANGRLRLLGPDRRGAMPAEGDVGAYAISALARAHALTVVDLGREAPYSRPDLLEWCDLVIVVCTAAAESVAQAGALNALLEERVPAANIGLVVNRTSTLAEGMAAAEDAGFEDAVVVRAARQLKKDLDHGVHLGQRKRCSITRDAGRILAAFVPEGPWTSR